MGVGNGSYSYVVWPIFGYASLPSSGTFTMSGANIVVNITFQQLPGTRYHLTFVEEGLNLSPVDVNWGVTLNGVSICSGPNSNAITFPVLNGTYWYEEWTWEGCNQPNDPGQLYIPSPLSGNVAVGGADATVGIAFASYPDSDGIFTLHESGLQAGTRWTASLAGSNTTTAGKAIEWALNPNATYHVAVYPVQGYAFQGESSGSAPEEYTVGTCSSCGMMMEVIFVNQSVGGAQAPVDWVDVFAVVVVAVTAVIIMMGLVIRRREVQPPQDADQNPSPPAEESKEQPRGSSEDARPVPPEPPHLPPKG
jgi:hypothetical protein